MNEDIFLDEMNLPKTNPNEELENLSRYHFNLLFDPSQFEIRSEDQRDKGIDLSVEIKNSGKHTNFRFLVQLKASESKLVNQDGSFSVMIDTANINYLLNGGNAAYYILYLKESNQFFYEDASQFMNTLLEKNTEWQKQQSHTLRFSKKLNLTSVDQIRKDTIVRGRFQRKINQKLAIKSAIQPGDKVLFDQDLNISSDQEIRENIETIGFYLLNEGRWKEIIAMHKNASGNVATTARYNLVLGIAQHYSGNYLEALSHFKIAQKLKEQLSNDLFKHLLYFDTIVRYSRGLISEEDYKIKISELENSVELGLYIRIDKVKQGYNTQHINFETFKLKINKIINDPNANSNIKLIAKCELLLIEGFNKNINYVQEVCRINAAEESFGIIPQIRHEVMNKLIHLDETWIKSIQLLKQEAIKTKNHFGYYMALLTEIRVQYESEVYKSSIYFIRDSDHVYKEVTTVKLILQKMIDGLNKSLIFYHSIGHIENLCVALAIKYEILHFIEDDENSKVVAMELENLIDDYEMIEFRQKLDFLKNNGTTHETFRSFVQNSFKKADSNKAEYDSMVQKMKRMDNEEKRILKDSKEYHIIDLFPIGSFIFPIAKKKQVYEILGIIDNKIVQEFDNIFEITIPVANIYYYPITQEGYIDGELADQGIDQWRNIYRIRKAFFEAAFYRFEKPNRA